jgi:hypothetical protein
MTNHDTAGWPCARFDAVDHLNLIARTVPASRIVERVIDAPVNAVWEFVADLETSIPTFDSTVRAVRILERGDDVLRMRAQPRFGPWMTFSCHLGDHRIVMVANHRLYLVGIAVRSLGPTHTLYAQVEGIPRHAGRFVNRFTSRHVAHDADTIKQLIEQRSR